MDFWLAKPATTISGSGNQVVCRDFLSVKRGQRFQLTWNYWKAAAIIIIVATLLILDSISVSKPIHRNRKKKTKPTLFIPMNRLRTHSSSTSPSSLPQKSEVPIWVQGWWAIHSGFNSSLQLYPYEHHHVFPGPSFCHSQDLETPWHRNRSFLAVPAVVWQKVNCFKIKEDRFRLDIMEVIFYD